MPCAIRVVLILLPSLFSACADESPRIPARGNEVGESPFSSGAAQVPAQPSLPEDLAIPVYVDPAVELICTIYRLAGLNQYITHELPPYIDDVEERFGPWRNHRAVALAQDLWERHRITGSAPVALAIYLTPPPELEGMIPLSPLPADLDPRWTPETVSTFLEAAREFSVDTDFMEFFSSQEDYYRRSVANLDDALADQDITGWLQAFFGREPGGYTVIVGMQTGYGNYGLSRIRTDGSHEFVSVMGASSPSLFGGIPRFTAWWVIPTIVHEFAHSFVNPFVFENEEALRPISERLFPSHREQMMSQGYSTWAHLAFEYLVRASVNQYLQDRGDQEALARRLEADVDQGFPGIHLLTERLDEYQANRDRYPTLTEFLPRIVDCFEEIHRTFEIGW
jgi:hypothetical protein